MNLIDFGSDVYTMLAPTWHHLRSQVGAILASKIAQVGAQDALGSQNPPRPHPGLDFDNYSIDLLVDFYLILDGISMGKNLFSSSPPRIFANMATLTIVCNL